MVPVKFLQSLTLLFRHAYFGAEEPRSEAMGSKYQNAYGMPQNAQPLKSGMGRRQNSEMSSSYDERRVKAGMDPHVYNMSDRYGSSMEAKMGSYPLVRGNSMTQRHSSGGSQMKAYEYPRPNGYENSHKSDYNDMESLHRKQSEKYPGAGVGIRHNYDYSKVSQNRMMNGTYGHKAKEGMVSHLEKDANVKGKCSPKNILYNPILNIFRNTKRLGQEYCIGQTSQIQWIQGSRERRSETL